MALEWLKNQYEAAKNSLTTEMTKFKNKEMMEAIVAACALVSHADGKITSEEKQKMIGYLRSSDTLKVFDTTDVIKIFENYVGKFDFDQQIGTGEAMMAISKFKGKSAESQLVIRVCCAVGASDGEFSTKEQDVVRKMCRELGLDPTNFDL